MVSLEGLDGLTYIGGDLYLMSNEQLTSLDGLQALTHLMGSFTASSNPSLCRSTIDDAVSQLTLTGTLTVAGNKEGC